ncbi:MAG: 8-oxoguanine deaminase [Caldiserica bacterium]|nr:MAG: 8-oxoguanine deaminase [Caldisericota bacterium]
MKRIVFKDASIVVTMNENMGEIKNCDVVVEGNEIVKVGKDLKEEGEIIDARGKILLPGFVNTHHHFYQILNRNMPAVQDAPLFKWLLYLYEVWRNLDEEWVRVSTKIAISELLLSGCTTALDHYYVFPKGKENLIDFEIEEAKNLRIRFHITRGGMSRGKSKGGLPPDDLVQEEEEILKDYERLVNKYHDSGKFSMLRIVPAPCSPFSVTEELLKETLLFARKHKLQSHTHLAETLDEEEYCKEKLGKKPAEWLEEIGFLGEDIILAHCIYLDDEDIKRLGKYKTGVSHCPSSNLRLGSGIAPIKKLHEAGCNISIGVDGSASNDTSNLWLEGRMALLCSRVKDKLTAREVLYFLTKGGAKVLGRDDIGEISPGKAADIILIDTNRIEFAGSGYDPVAGILFSGGNFRVDLNMINGKILVKDGKLLIYEEEKLIEEARKVERKILEKI